MGLVFASAVMMSGDEALSAFCGLRTKGASALIITCLDFGEVHASLAERATAGQHRHRWSVAFESPLVHMRICGFVPRFDPR